MLNDLFDTLLYLTEAKKFWDTPEFKRWFGNSKVVDKYGNPLVVYHHGQFDEEDGAPIIEEGMHFGTEDAARARAYGKIVDDFVLSIEVFEEDGCWHWEMGSFASWDIDNEGFETEEEARENAEEAALEIAKNEVLDADELGTFTKAFLKIENPKVTKDMGAYWSKVIEQAKQQGYDGIIYRNEFEDRGSLSYIVFKPEQIKSVNNKGTFDPNSSNIMERKEL